MAMQAQSTPCQDWQPPSQARLSVFEQALLWKHNPSQVSVSIAQNRPFLRATGQVGTLLRTDAQQACYEAQMGLCEWENQT